MIQHHQQNSWNWDRVLDFGLASQQNFLHLTKLEPQHVDVVSEEKKLTAFV